MIQGSQISAPPNTGDVGGPERARCLRENWAEVWRRGTDHRKVTGSATLHFFYPLPTLSKTSYACAERRAVEGKPHIVPSDLPWVDSGWAARGTREDQPSPLSHNEGLITGPASLKSHGSRPPVSVLRSPNILIALLFSLCIYCASLAPLGSFPRLSHFHT